MFLADCLHVNQFCRGCCSWSMHAMRVFLPWLAYLSCILSGCMLSLSCNALWWVHRAREHAYVTLFLPCSSFLLSLNLLTKLAMFTWLPLYLLILFGLWSVKDFCHMNLVEYFHALFSMLSSCSMLISCSEHCYLMLFSAMSSNFTKSGTCYLLHFCHACLSLLCCELAVAQCSSFFKHLL